jgi:GGDEF domain-containing protein
MISIKRFLDQQRGNEPDREVVEALRHAGRIVVDSVATHTVHGREQDFGSLRQALQSLAEQIDAFQSAPGLLSSSNDVAEALETHCDQTTKYFREEKGHMRAMVIMLSETVADVSGQSDLSVARLQSIEKELEVASGLNDLKAVRLRLEICLAGLREANAKQRSSSSATVQRLQDHVDKVEKRIFSGAEHVPFSQAEIEMISALRDGPGKVAFHLYVAAFKLKRAEHIASRFGEAATQQMLSTLGQLLKAVLGSHDRLLRRQGSSFVMFINTTATIREIRTQLSETVDKIGMQPVEVGKKSALLAVGVDWIILPHAEQASLNVVLADIDKFLAGTSLEKSAVATGGRLDAHRT